MIRHRIVEYNCANESCQADIWFQDICTFFNESRLELSDQIEDQYDLKHLDQHHHFKIMAKRFVHLLPVRHCLPRAEGWYLCFRLLVLNYNIYILLMDTFV